MRIIAGEMRSRRLKAPEGMDTRPTADKVKEALFSILLRHVPGARVLDLYAGSGALSLEALSRGARSAVLADKSKKACQVIRENIQTLEYSDRARLLAMDDHTALTLLRKEGAQFDLVFLDPPYRMVEAYADALLRLNSMGCISEDTLIVMERMKATPVSVPDGFESVDVRFYGETAVEFVKKRSLNNKEENTEDGV